MVRHPDFRNIHQELIDKLKDGDRKAQYRIYELYYKAMYNTSLRIVNVPEDAEDIMQESFLAAYRNILSYSGKASFGAWLKKIVINRSLDHLRNKHGILVSIEEIEERQSEYENGQENDNPDVDKLSADQVREAIQALPRGYRIVLSLYLLEGYDHQEIAQILGISGSASRSQYARARQKLLETLKKHE